MAETYTQEEMEAAYKNCFGIWEGRDLSYIENIRGERRQPMNKYLRIASLALLIVVALTRLQIVNGYKRGEFGQETTRYISFR